MKLFKDKTFKVAFLVGLSILLFFLVFLVWEYNRAGIFLKNENWRLELENRRHQERLDECKKYPLFEQAVSKIGDRVYDLENYNCIDFSKDLVKELEEVWIKSSIAIDKDRTHAWVIVWIEATTGRFVIPGKDLGLLEIRDKNMNVICK